MSRTRIAVWLVLLAAACGYAFFQWPAPPRTLAQAEQEEREIMAGTRQGRPAPAEVRAEREDRRLGERQVSEADSMTALFEHCHAAVRRRYLLSRTVTADDGLLPPNGYPFWSTYRGERIVGISSQPPDPAYYAPLEPPLSGRYLVTGTVRHGEGAGAGLDSYDCRILAWPPIFVVVSTDTRPVR